MFHVLIIGPSPPREVQGFCSVVVWKMPRSPNGKIIGYDLRIIHEEAVILSESDGPFLVIREVNQLIGALVQVWIPKSFIIGYRKTIF